MPSGEKSITVFGPEVLLDVGGNDDQRYNCTMLGMTQGKIHLRSEEWFPPGLSVTASFAHLKVSGEVEYCTKKDMWFRICIQIQSGDRQRREPRLAVRENSTITALAGDSSSGRIESTKGLIVDIAVAGMGIEMSHPVQPGTMIFIETRSSVIAGEVRHCRERDDERFDVGISVTDILIRPEEKLRTGWGRKISGLVGG
jgi:hypothetical protein